MHSQSVSSGTAPGALPLQLTAHGAPVRSLTPAPIPVPLLQREAGSSGNGEGSPPPAYHKRSRSSGDAVHGFLPTSSSSSLASATFGVALERDAISLISGVGGGTGAVGKVTEMAVTRWPPQTHLCCSHSKPHLPQRRLPPRRLIIAGCRSNEAAEEEVTGEASAVRAPPPG